MRSQRRDTTIYLRVEVQTLWTMNAVSNTSSGEVEVVVAVLGCRGPPLESSTESLTIFGIPFFSIPIIGVPILGIPNIGMVSIPL